MKNREFTSHGNRKGRAFRERVLRGIEGSARWEEVLFDPLHVSEAESYFKYNLALDHDGLLPLSILVRNADKDKIIVAPSFEYWSALKTAKGEGNLSPKEEFLIELSYSLKGNVSKSLDLQSKYIISEEDFVCLPCTNIFRDARKVRDFYNTPEIVEMKERYVALQKEGEVSRKKYNSDLTNLNEEAVKNATGLLERKIDSLEKK